VQALYQDHLLRTVRLVIDTGIHAKSWTREEAAAYWEEATDDACLTSILPRRPIQANRCLCN
jgi:uncharacterized protein (DUF885 family)